MIMRIQNCLKIALFASIFAIPTNAFADIFKYEAPSGEVIFTTEPRNDLKLIEIIGSTAKPAKSSSKPRQSAPATAPTAPKKVQDPSHAYDDFIREASQKYDIPFHFIKAVIKIESNFNPRAVSRVGAMGLMQLMPATARHMEVDDPFDPRQNILGGTRYLRHLSDRYDGDINLILSGYNAGPGNVARAGGIPFEETQRYVKNVYAWYIKYREMDK